MWWVTRVVFTWILRSEDPLRIRKLTQSFRESTHSIEHLLSSPFFFLDVKVQPAGDNLAALHGKDALFLRKVVHFMRHLLHSFLIGFQAPADHLGSATLHHVFVLQGKEGHKEVHHVLVYQASVPKTTWKKKKPGEYNVPQYSFPIDIWCWRLIFPHIYE